MAQVHKGNAVSAMQRLLAYGSQANAPQGMQTDARSGLPVSRRLMPHPAAVRNLQTTMGNRAVTRLISGISNRAPAGRPNHVARKGVDSIARCARPGSDRCMKYPEGGASQKQERAPDTSNAATEPQTGGSLQIQRLSWDDVTDAVSSTADAIGSGVQAVGSAISSGAQAVGSAVASGAEAASDVVSSGAAAAGQAVSSGAAAVGQAASSGAKTATGAAQAVASGITNAGDEAVQGAALAQAEVIARLFGGKVTVSRNGVEVDVGDIELAEVEDQTFVAPIGIPTLTLFSNTFKVGDFVINGWAGVIFGDPALTVAVGPVRLQNVKLIVNPLGKAIVANAEIYVGTALSGSIERANEARLQAAGVIPLEVPVPIWGSAEIGTRAILRVIGKAGLQRGVEIGYADGGFFLNTTMNLGLGGVIQVDHEAFVRIEVEGEQVCSMIWPFSSHRLAEGGVELSLPVSLSVSGKQATVVVGPPGAKAIPADSIETALQDGHEPERCMGLKEFGQFLCKKGKLPPTVCWLLQPRPGGPGDLGPGFGPMPPMPLVPDGEDVEPSAQGGKKHKAPIGSRDDPIAMVWVKPLGYYDNPLNLDGGVYQRDRQKLLTDKVRRIGVPFWPGVGDIVQKKKVARGGKEREFKQALCDEGYEDCTAADTGEWGDYSPDHVVDLEFNGADAFNNLWPLEKDVNRRAGTWQTGQGVIFNLPDDPPDAPPRREAIQSTRLDGCYFKIIKVRTPP